MLVEREHVVTVFMAVIVMLIILGGYASFSGLSVYQETLVIEMAKDSFSQGDVFDVTVVLNPVTLMSDDSLMIYVDGNAIGVVAIKKYLDENGIAYGSEFKNSGQNNIEIITMRDRLLVNLADHVSLEHMSPGSAHALMVELSKGEASAEGIFSVR
ncbi:hypothetical protein ACFL3V_03540 [Nanoarchaeota archaeon]